MLAKFAVTNYRGFKDRIEWDLSKHSHYEFHTEAIRDGIIKNGILYGPNGCGKTNFSLAIFDIVNHLSDKWRKPDYYRNFAYAGRIKDPVKFEYTFKFGSDILEYEYLKDPNGRLVTENLKRNGSVVFEAGPNVINCSSEFKLTNEASKNFLAGINRVSLAKNLLTTFPLPEDHYLIKLSKFVDSMLWYRNLDAREFIGLDTAIYNLDEFIISEGLLEDFTEFIQRISDQDFKLLPGGNGKQIICDIEGTLMPFDEIASTGTADLMLFYFWFKHLSNASFVFIDEFDAFYHFNLSIKVCRELFALDCQAFTSTHNTYIQTNDLLRPDCNFILDNGEIHPLCDLTEKELRFGHNIEKIYRAGGFNGK